MTRKHFAALAAVLRDLRPARGATTQAQWEAAVKTVASMCAQNNRNFNASRFYAACGLE